MKLEIYDPNDGYKYQIIWCWSKEIKGYIYDDDEIYVTFPNGHYGSGFFNKSHTPIDVATQLNCNLERAMAIHRFMETKFKQQVGTKEIVK